MSFMGNLSGVCGERVGVASQEEKLLSWFCVTLHLRHCWEEKTGNFTRVRQCRQLFVLEKNIKKSKWLYGKCSALLYTCGIAGKRRLEISRACASADNSLYLKKHQKIKMIIWKMLIRRRKVFSRLVFHKEHSAPPRVNYPHFAWPAWRVEFQVGIN